MKQESEQATQDVHTEAREAYEAPRIEVIEMETEQPILAGSNSPWEPDQW